MAPSSGILQLLQFGTSGDFLDLELPRYIDNLVQCVCKRPKKSLIKDKLSHITSNPAMGLHDEHPLETYL